MSVTLRAKNSLHLTTQGEIWDIIAYREYGDEHAMHYVQDANFEDRFVDEFPGNVALNLTPVVSLEYNFRARRSVPNLKQLLPWL